MLYRVVLQGHVAQGADVTEVKREFMRITALPSSVTERLFGGTRKVIKRQMPEADAERIALTLRAIGAAATIERELDAGPDVGPEGPATLAPLVGSDPGPLLLDSPPVDAPVATKSSRWRALARRSLPWLAAAGVCMALAPLAAPVVDEWVLRAPAVPPASLKPVPKATAAEEKPELVPLKPENLHGPWRCTNQTTGRSLYWLYNADGTLDFFGESDFASGKPLTASADVPTDWTLEGNHVTWSYASQGPHATVVNTVLDLSLTKFNYIDSSRIPIACRRP
jgi:hypothetical protein